MEPHMLFLSSVLTFSFLLTTFPISHCQQDERYRSCQSLFNCGTVKDIGYPFWSDDAQRPHYCGSDGFQLFCHDNQIPSIHFGLQTFNVLSINVFAYSMKMVRTDLKYDNCFWDLTNTSFRTLSSAIQYESDVKNVTLFYNCPSDISNGRNDLSCQSKDDGFVFYANDIPLQQFPKIKECTDHIEVPISGNIAPAPERGIAALIKALKEEGFGVKYGVESQSGCSKCMESEGVCGSVIDKVSEFTCYCRDGPHRSDCHDSNGSHFSLKNKVIVASVTCTISVIVMFIALYFYRLRKKNSYAKSYIQSRATSSDSSIVVELENESKYYGVVPIFSYNELEEATNNFDSAKELGDGGFGTVYFGKLRDGRYVAVKRLYENNYKRVEQFMNEVQILTRLRHRNLVSLYGCTSRHSRELLLVYEYVPNGTVADHLHGERAKPGTLPWNIRMNIAIETASALAYLHASDVIVIHRDVKTNNILLDEHFCVKVADFGLSRLFPDYVTHISTAPQGTPGYLDPEYHECYQLTDKSDVYSFGVVLIELISSMPAVDITRHRHEINLSTMAINKIQNRALHELVDPTLGFESDYRVRKMINAVAELAFQCLQSMKDMRPSMKEVLDALRDIESDGKHKSKPEVMDIADDVVLLGSDLPSPSLDSNLASKSTTSNDSK